MAENVLTSDQIQQLISDRQIPAGHRHPSSSARLPWMISRVESNYLLKSGQPAILFWVNPSSCQWKIATRTTIEKISGGIVHHEWPQTGMYGTNAAFKGSRLDQPVLSIAFQSGNINPSSYQDLVSLNEFKGVPPGLGNFFDFLDIIDQPDTTETGTPNYVNIFYTSPVSGDNSILLQGFFTEEGVAWTDEADNPNVISSWGASFIVFNSQPRLTNLSAHFAHIGIQTF